MGKSSQGAGGVLVFGTAFDVIVQRTKNNQWGTRIDPHKWIANAYRELNQVFLSFQGLMLMSMVLGIIEDDSGIVHFINVEHPNTILYRDKKASFIEKTFTHYKLGSSFVESDQKVQIHKIKLQSGDIMLMGSDGRDDIIIDNMVNEDENLILSFIEKSDADLQKIYNLITDTGKLKDDLSLLRVEYLG